MDLKSGMFDILSWLAKSLMAGLKQVIEGFVLTVVVTFVAISAGYIGTVVIGEFLTWTTLMCLGFGGAYIVFRGVEKRRTVVAIYGIFVVLWSIGLSINFA